MNWVCRLEFVACNSFRLLTHVTFSPQEDLIGIQTVDTENNTNDENVFSSFLWLDTGRRREAY